MASLVDQIFQQAQLGTAVSPDANPFATGVQLGQNQQRLNMAREELNANLATLPLTMTLKQQDARKNALEIENMLTARENYLKGQEAMTQLDKDIGMALSEAEPIDALKLHAREGLKNPILLDNSAYKQLGKQLEALTKEADLAQYRLDIANARQTAADAAKTRADAMGTKAAPVEPEVKVIEGSPYLVNPKTGHFEKLDKTVNKQQFVTQHIAAFMKDNMLDERESADRLEKLYDEKIAPMSKKPSTGLGEKVRVKKDGKSYLLPKSQLEEAVKQGYVPE